MVEVIFGSVYLFGLYKVMRFYGYGSEREWMRMAANRVVITKELLPRSVELFARCYRMAWTCCAHGALHSGCGEYALLGDLIVCVFRAVRRGSTTGRAGRSGRRYVRLCVRRDVNVWTTERTCGIGVAGVQPVLCFILLHLWIYGAEAR